MLISKPMHDTQTKKKKKISIENSQQNKKFCKRYQNFKNQNIPANLARNTKTMQRT